MLKALYYGSQFLGVEETVAYDVNHQSLMVYLEMPGYLENRTSAKKELTHSLRLSQW